MFYHTCSLNLKHALAASGDSDEGRRPRRERGLRAVGARGEPRDAQDHTPPRALIAERATWQRLGLAGLAFTAWRRGHTLKLLVSNDF